jgi:regulatory protein
MPTRRNPEREQKLKAYARELRTLQTDAEARLWHLLRDRRFFGHKFRRQHSVENFILDFYCPEQYLAIELDGGQHSDQRVYDEKREQTLASMGIRMLRFWNHNLLQQTEAVLEVIYDALEQAPAAPHPQPLSAALNPPHPGPLPLKGAREEPPSTPLPASGKRGRGEGRSSPLSPLAGRGAGDQGPVAERASGVAANTLRDRALAYLARRDHTRLELARKLQRAGHAEADSEALLDELAQRGCLSNQRFAEAYVQQKQQRFGALKLAHELRSRGVEESDIQQALSHDMETELQRARQVWEKRFGAPPTDTRDKARQMRFLQGRGFAPEVIRRVLRTTAEGSD